MNGWPDSSSSHLKMSINDSPYHLELGRLASFANCEGVKHVAALAKHGFFWNSRDKRLCCYSCDFSLSSWVSSNEVMQGHERVSPLCTMTNDNTEHRYLKMTPQDLENKLRAWVSGSTRMKRLPDATDCEEREPFIVQCRNLMERAKKKGILRYQNVLIDLNKPDFELLKDERNRLSTFTNWPQDAHAFPADLARNGLFYTGLVDKVQCAFCHGFIDNWAPEDVASDEHRKFFPCCPIATGVNCGNLPINQRRGSDEIVLGDSAARNLSLSEQDNCSSMGRASVEQNRLLSAGNDTRDGSINVAITEGERTAAAIMDARHRNKHPDYCTHEDRLATYQNPFAMIPRGQNIDTLVDAGFFLVGPHDNVKCFCCDIGLKNWQNDDNPWVEHARWSPRCRYLREKKDDAFIEEALANRHRFENVGIQLPSLNIEPSQTSLISNASMVPGFDVAGIDNTRPPAGMDELLGGPGVLVRDGRPMGVDYLYLGDGENLGGFDYIADDYVAEDGVGELRDARELMLQNEELQELRICKVCRDRDANVVFLPCGHLVCCDTCAPNLRTCAVCRVQLRGTVKINFA